MSSDFFILSEQNDSFSAHEDSSGFNGGSNINVLAQTIAPLYSDAATYDVGDYVMYNGELYVCTTAITTPETWTIGHWSQTDVINSIESQIPVIDDTLSIAGAAADAKAVGDALGDLKPVKVYVPATFIQGSRNSAGTLDTSYKYRITTDDKFTVPKLISYPIPDGYQARVTSFNISTGVKIADESNVREFVTFRNDRSYVMTIRRITENTSEQADPDAMYNQVYRVVSSAKHLRIMIFGHSYSADSWQYVPFMLKNYGITCEIYLYYRGNGSIDQLVSQWEDTGSTGEDAWGNSHPRRYCHIDSRYTDCWDDAYGLEGYSAKMVLETAAADGKIDLITLQTAPTEVYFVESVGGSDPRKGYEPYVRQAINLINASYNDSYALGWFCSYTRHLAYEGNVSEGYPAVSADTFDNKEDTLRAAETIYTAEPFDMVIPAAAAVFNARTNDDLASTNISLHGNLWFSDKVHLQSGIPCYVTNATVAQCLFDKFFPGLSVYGDQFRVPNDDWVTKRRCIMPSIHGSVLSTSEALYDLAQKCAIAACEHPFDITQILNPSDTEEITFSDPMSRYWELKASIGEATSALTTKMNNGVARDFSSASSYQKDDIVFYNGSLYRFTSSHSGAWSGTDVVPEYNAFKNINRIDTKIENGVAPMFSTATAYSAGDYVYYGSKLYRFKVNHTGAWSASDVEAVLLGESLNTNKADIIVSSASGTIASFADGANGLPVKNLTVNVEPVQDLHGYANPWPAGGGANKIDLRNVDITIGGGVHVVGDSQGILSLSGTRDSSSGWKVIKSFDSLPAGDYYFSTSDSHITCLLNWTQKTTTFTVSSGDVVRVALNFQANETVNITGVKVQISEGSTAPTAWTPYSNICPITGKTTANVYRFGKNLMNAEDFAAAGAGTTITKAPGSVKMVNTSGTRYYGANLTSLINLLPKVKFTFSFDISGVETTWAIGLRKSAGNLFHPTYKAATNTDGHYSFTFDVSELTESYYFSLSRTGNSTANSDVTVSNMLLEVGETETTYEDYQPKQSIEVTFPSSAGTVYGGTLDVHEDGSGTLSVDRYYFDGGSVDWTKATGSNYRNFATPLPNIALYIINVPTVISSIYKSESNNSASATADNYVWLNGSTYLSIKDTSKANMTEAAFKTAMTGVQFAYWLATPIEYTLTASQLTTLLGTNNIWADTGDISVEYRADTKLYIERLTAPTEDDMIANTNIASGKFFMIGNNLYLSTTAIASGAQITVGTNATKLSLADALNQINS